MITQLVSDYVLLLPPLLAGAIVLSTHVPLGRQVIKRGIIFIDLAIAQIAGLGIIIANYLGLALGTWQLQVFALTSALIGAIILSNLERLSGDYQEAIIGIIFVLSATASMMLLSSNPHSGEALQDLLIGQILWVDWLTLLYPALVSIFIIMIFIIKPTWLTGKSFYLLFAVAITGSVQLIGIYLVFANLIIPALAVVKYTHKYAVIHAYTIGILSYLIGLWLSTITDLPSGAVIVWVMAVLSLIYYLFRKKANQRRMI